MGIDDRVLIFDTTLRDGEQSPGCSMTQPEKLRVAKALAELGVDVIEAGFPAASKGDFEAVNAVAREVQGPIIAALARCAREDIETAAKAHRAGRPRPHCTCSWPPARSIASSSSTWRARRSCAVPSQGVRWAREHCARRGVLARGCLAHGARLPGPGRGGGHRGRRDDDQYSRIPSATRSRMSSRRSSATCARTCAGSRRRGSPCTATTIWAWRWPTA